MFMFPMAGSSQRFKDAGFKVPKYMLKAHEHTLFHFAVRGFHRYFSDYSFVFIVRSDLESRKFVEDECGLLGIRKFTVLELNRSTSGQAETVALGLQEIGNVSQNPFGVFNIDTFRRDFQLPEYALRPSAEYGGYLEVVRASGDHWSFVRPAKNDRRVLEVREKMRISDLCSTGFYHFVSPRSFLQAYHHPQISGSEAEAKERYVAPLYNYVIGEGKHVFYNVIEATDVCFCGTPAEYASFVQGDWLRLLG